MFSIELSCFFAENIAYLIIKLFFYIYLHYKIDAFSETAQVVIIHTLQFLII